MTRFLLFFLSGLLSILSFSFLPPSLAQDAPLPTYSYYYSVTGLPYLSRYGPRRTVFLSFSQSAATYRIIPNPGGGANLPDKQGTDTAVEFYSPTYPRLLLSFYDPALTGWSSTDLVVEPTSSSFFDTDGDGITDDLDNDDDNDGFLDSDDSFPLDPSRGPVDTDGDGVSDPRDSDDDNDGTPDSEDPFPLDPSRGPVDTDGDGVSDPRDSDDDNDGTPDSEDPFPLDPSRGPVDTDGDGAPDYLDSDDDGDGLADSSDPYPLDPNQNPNPVDTDGDGTPDSQDADDDGDGVPDSQDADDDGDGEPDSSECSSDQSGDSNFLSFVADKLATFLPRSPESIRLPTLLSNMMGQGSLAGNLAVELYSGIWQYLAIIAFIKFYQLIPGKFT